MAKKNIQTMNNLRPKIPHCSFATSQSNVIQCFDLYISAQKQTHLTHALYSSHRLKEAQLAYKFMLRRRESHDTSREIINP